ncbi:hypothetical protein L7F22_060244 [Adiantum nelumboides]|nr:hypothetical protein [Adiantum nelumboides]
MADQRITAWLQSFDSALKSRDIPSAVDLFCAEECYWRDLVAFTWNLYTAESREEIHAMLDATLHHTSPSAWTIDGPSEEAEDSAVLQAFITFETQRARGRGYVKLKGDKCWCLLTSMLELKGFEEKAGLRRELGVLHGAVKSRKTWLDGRAEELQGLGRSKQPYCLIVGGGQAGISLGARLRRLCVPTIIVEKNKRPGDSWRNRYKSLCLHDPVWYDHLPYLLFPSHWPVFSPKDKIGDWLEAYTEIMELVYWSSTECKSAQFNASKGTWEVLVEREGEKIMLYPKELILATGMSGFPNVPKFFGSERFQGLQCHSSEYKGGESCKGKHCIVIGSNNSAHDICAEMWENEAAEVTMVQRSSTHVARSKTKMKLGYGEYAEHPRHSVDDADLLFASVPYKIFHRSAIPACKRLQEVDAEFYRRLKDCGFMHDFGDDDSGLFVKYLRRGSGYYIDVGACDLVINGDIKLKSGVEVKEVKEKSVVFSDGTEAKAEVIVYATGYGSMNEWAARLISQEVADKVGKCWGLGSGTTKDPGPWERELRNMWKPTQQESLWFHGGNLHQCRHYSLLLALQLKARMEGIATPVYGLAKVHHNK